MPSLSNYYFILVPPSIYLDGNFLHGYEHLIGGLCGGVASTMTCHPFDLLKIRYSANEGSLIRPKYNGYIHAVRSILKASGFRGLYQGLSPSIIGAPVSWGMYFHLYHKVRAQTEIFPAVFANNLLAGSVTGGIVLAITNPMWVCKTRLCLQYETSQKKQKEGFGGFYRGFIPGLMGTTNGAIQFAIYNQMKDVRCKYLNLEQDSELATFDYLLFSAMSKISSTVLTFPYQVLRTRLQDQHASYNGVVDCATKTFRREGMGGLYKGMWVAILKQLPNGVVTYVVYEKSGIC
uniref:Mitochondrial folate transporter/carrier n=1 Tax=Ditylenchus dipsaci TaxID=166011 RepID=A0A915E086_9BILA